MQGGGDRGDRGRQHPLAARGRVYEAIRDKAAAALAEKAGVPFTGLWLEAPPETMKARLGARRDDASDATASVLAGQLGHDPGALDWRRLAAGGDPDKTLAAARHALGLD